MADGTAPSGGTGAAAPGAPPAGATAADAGSGTLPGITPAAATRKLAPIPSPKQPSGKSPDGSARPKPPSLPGVVINRPTAEGGMPGRDNIGRFVARGDGAEGDADDPIERELRADRRPGETVADDEGEASADPKAKTPDLKTAAKPELPPGAVDPSKARVKFGDRTYDTHEQALSAAQAVLGNLNKTTGDLRTRTEERDYGYQAAYAWKDAHDKAIQELTALRGGKAPAAGAQSGASTSASGAQASTALPANVDELLNAMSPDVFKGFEETLLAKGIPDAGKYLMQHTLDAVMQKILPALRAEMAEKSAPFEEFAGNAQAEENAGQLIQRLVSARGPDGQEAFPELKDPQIVHEIGTTWRNAGMDPAIALTDAGLIAAVGLYRTVKGFSGPAAMIPASPSTPAGAFVAPRAGVAASISADGDTSIAPGAKRQDMSITDPNARRLASALRHAAPLRDPVLGFPRARAHR